MGRGPKKRKNKKEDYYKKAEVELIMTLDDCNHAEEFWQDHWTKCPVCHAEITASGIVHHKPTNRYIN